MPVRFGIAKPALLSELNKTSRLSPARFIEILSEYLQILAAYSRYTQVSWLASITAQRLPEYSVAYCLAR